MEPIELGALTVYPFGLIVFALLIPFFFLCARRMKKQGLNKETASWFALLAVPLCFLFARLGFCVLTVDQIIGSEDYLRFFHFSKGGYLLWGAIAGLLLAAKFAGKAAGESGAKIADSAVVPACLMILAVRLLCGLLFKGFGIGFPLDYWFDPEETDPAWRYSLFPLEDYSFFERFPFAALSFEDYWCWAVFVLQALWAGLIALPLSRTKAEPGGKAVRFLVLYSCGSIAMESMLHAGEILYLPWQSFIKANMILSAVAILACAGACLHRLAPGARLRAALLFFPQFLASVGIIIVMEFAAFEKKLPAIEWLPADACHLIMILACLWIALAFRPLRKKAYRPL